MAEDVAANVHQPRPKERRLVMLGRTGAGMTCTANNILQEHIFKERVDTKSKTQRCDLVHRTINNRRLSIVDTPGFFNTEGSDKDIDREIYRYVSFAYPGPHVFLLVISMTNRFSPEAQETIRRMEAKFGNDFYKYLIVVFTGKDTLDHENRGFGEFLQDGVHPMIEDVLRRCNNHCVPFNNKADAQENVAQVKTLLDVVDQVVAKNGGGFFSAETFNSVGQRLRRKVVSSISGISGKLHFNLGVFYIVVGLLMVLCFVTSIFTITWLIAGRQSNSDRVPEKINLDQVENSKEQLSLPDKVSEDESYQHQNTSHPPTPVVRSIRSYHYTQILLSSVRQGKCLKVTCRNRCVVVYWFDPKIPPAPVRSYPYTQILLSSVRHGMCPSVKNRRVRFWFDPKIPLPPIRSYPYTQVLLSAIRHGVCLENKRKNRCIGYWYDLPYEPDSWLRNTVNTVKSSLKEVWFGLSIY